MRYLLKYSQPLPSRPNGDLAVWEAKEHRFEAADMAEAEAEKNIFLAQGAVTILGTTYPRQVGELTEEAAPTKSAEMLPEFAATLEHPDCQLGH